MEKVSEEVLDRMLADYIRTSDSCKGGKGPSYMVQALTELRELRKVMGAVDEHLQVRPSITISHDIVNDEFIAVSGACKALGRDAFSALAALVKGWESPCP